MKGGEAFYRYTKALFQIQASQELDLLLTGCVQLMQDSPPFAAFLYNPQFRPPLKRKVLQACVQNPLLVHFLILLIERKRLKDLPKIAGYYHKMRLEQLGLMEAQLVTAQPLNADLTQQLKNRLETAYGKTFSVQTTVDPQLISGAILHVGNTFLDYSLKGRLAALKNTLLRGVNAT